MGSWSRPGPGRRLCVAARPSRADGRAAPHGHRDVRRPRRRWGRHRCRRGPGRGGTRAVGGSGRAARLGRRHLQPVEQARPRWAALPRAEGLPARPRGAARAPPADHDDRPAPGATPALPLPAQAPDLGARLRRRRSHALRRSRWHLGRGPPPSAPLPRTPPSGSPRRSPRTRSPGRSATTTPRSTTRGTPWPWCVRRPGWAPPARQPYASSGSLKEASASSARTPSRHRGGRGHRGARPRRHRRRRGLDDRLRDAGRGARNRSRCAPARASTSSSRATGSSRPPH